MHSHRRLPTVFLALLALALVVACSQDDGGSNLGQGNVRVLLTSAGTTTNALVASGSSTASLPGTGGTTSFDGDDDDDDDDDGDDGDDGDGGSGDVLSRLENFNVTFSAMLARNLEGDLVDLVIDLPRTVDLIPVISGQEISLPVGTLPPGMYDQFVVVITQVELVFLNGMRVALTPPGGGWTRIVPVTPFEVIDGQTVTIELRFRPWQALREFDGRFHFSPDFDCERR